MVWALQPLCDGQRGCILLSRDRGLTSFRLETPHSGQQRESTLLLLPFPGCFCLVKGPPGELWPGQKDLGHRRKKIRQSQQRGQGDRAQLSEPGTRPGHLTASPDFLASWTHPPSSSLERSPGWRRPVAPGAGYVRAILLAFRCSDAFSATCCSCY